MQGEDEEIRQLPTVVDGQTKKQSVDRSIRMETARLDRSCGKNKIILGREAQTLEHREWSKDKLVEHQLLQGEDEEICRLPTVVRWRGAQETYH